MAEQPQVIVQPKIPENKAFGARNQINLVAAFPSTPVYTDLSDEERMKFRNKRLETASQGKQAPLLIDCPWLYSNLKKKK